MKNESISIIEAVTNPLGFFVLVVLLVEVIFGIAAVKFEKQRGLIVVAMITLIFVLVGIVSFLSYCRPEALRGARYEADPEIAQIRQNFRDVEHLANMVIGDWIFVTQYQPDGQQQPVEVKGSCKISKGKYGISMHGNITDPDGEPGTAFIVKQVFVNEDGLTYIYEVPQSLGRAILGVGKVRFVHAEGESLVTQMRGNWAVLGHELSGKAEFNRNN